VLNAVMLDHVVANEVATVLEVVCVS
jgi:hypothetical protein